MSSDDLVLAFFPCIYFCDNNNFYFTDVAVNLNIRHKNDIYGRYKEIIKRSDDRQYFYKLLWKMVAISKINNIRLIIENPWNSNGLSFLQHNFIKPSIVDKNRMIRGDYLKKPTAYWFINCENTNGFSYQNDKQQKTIRKISGSSEGGICSEERSMISKDYARNWICDFVLGKQQEHLMQSELF